MEYLRKELMDAALKYVYQNFNIRERRWLVGAMRNPIMRKWNGFMNADLKRIQNLIYSP